MDYVVVFFFFFFQAEDGIRDHCVTGVQTCALPICDNEHFIHDFIVKCLSGQGRIYVANEYPTFARTKIGRASCRERV